MTPSSITDLDRAKFLEKLSDSSHSAHGVYLTEREADFVASFKRAYRYWMWMTDGRRKWADALRVRLGVEIGMPMPQAPAANRSTEIPAADPGCCMYLVRLDGRQQRCNLPAQWQSPANKFLYCDAHGAAAERYTKHLKKPVHLVAYP